MPFITNPETGQSEWTNAPATAGAGGSAPSGEAASLVSTPAAVNLANQTNFDALSKMVNQINQQAQQQANLSRIPGAAQLEEQSSQNIQNLLAGNLPTSFTQNLQSALAQQYGGRGFGVDTQAMNAAALRGMGLEQQNLQLQGEQALAGAYARNPSAPIWDVSRGMLTPENYQTYLNQKAQQAAAAASLSEQARQFNEDLAFRKAQAQGAGGGAGYSNAYDIAKMQYETQLQMAQMEQDMAQKALNEKIRQFNYTGDTQTAMQIAQLREQANQAKLNAQLAQQQLNASVWSTALQYMDPQFAASQALFTNQLPQYVTTSASPGSNMIQMTDFKAPTFRTLGGW